MKNNYSRTNSTHIDALKENKALYDMPWEMPSGSNISAVTITHTSNSITTTSVTRPMSSSSVTASNSNNLKIHSKISKKAHQTKSQNLFGKKENTTTSKKLKVLCEASTSSSFIKSQNVIKVTSDQQIQVPRKRIKVSSQIHHQHQPVSVKSVSDHESTCSNYEEAFLKVYGKSTSNISTSSSSFFPPSSDLSHHHSTGIKSKIDVNKSKSYSTTTIDSSLNDPLNIPCCSLTLKRNTKHSSPSASSKTQQNIINIPQTIKVTGTTNITTNTCSTSGTNNPTIMKSLTKSKFLRKSNSLPNLSKKVASDGTKLKKKRILKKSETPGLKRKKTRCKKLWH